MVALLPDQDTLLVIRDSSDPLIPLYAARGLTQTLDPIDAQADVRRTLNAELIDVSNTAFRKYQSRVSCTDRHAPALEGVWAGMTVSVECVTELCYLTSGGTAGKTGVSGSFRTAGDYTFYRPQLTMLVTGIETETVEWDADVAWVMTLEEV